MSQTLKVVLAVFITAIIVGGGVYYWQEQRVNKLESKSIDQSKALVTAPAPSAPTAPKTKSVEEGWSVLYTDEKNGFRVVAKSECAPYLKAEGNEKGVSISLPRAKQWGGELTGYLIQTQDEFNEAVRTTVSTELSVNLLLKNGLLLTTYSPQDLPSEEDLPIGCWPNPELL